MKQWHFVAAGAILGSSTMLLFLKPADNPDATLAANSVLTQKLGSEGYGAEAGEEIVVHEKREAANPDSHYLYIDALYKKGKSICVRYELYDTHHETLKKNLEYCVPERFAAKNLKFGATPYFIKYGAT